MALERQAQRSARRVSIYRFPKIEIDGIVNRPDPIRSYTVALHDPLRFQFSADDQAAGCSQRDRPNEILEPSLMPVTALKRRINRQAKQASKQDAHVEPGILVFLRQ